MKRLFQPVDIASLVVFRVVFGCTMMVEVWRYFKREWIDRYFIDPEFHFKYYGFGWVKPWPDDGMYWHFVVMAVLGLFIAIGFCYRLSAILFFLAFTQVFLIDQATYLNHFYLVSLISFLMIFLPVHRARSVDARFRPKLRSETVPAWTLCLVQFQLGVAYFFGGIAKLNSDWLAGQPITRWLESRSDYPLMGRLFEQPWAGDLFGYGGLLLDLFVVPLLLWRRTRILAMGAVLFFHVMNSWLFDIGIFPWFMIAGTLIFFPPDWPRRVVLLFTPRTEPPEPLDSPTTLHRRLVTGLLATWVSLQVLVPMRHVLYPGNVHWTEEGHRFSWHMKLRDKSSRISFEVTLPELGKKWTIDQRECRRYLSHRQVRKMSTRPDMIIQFVHYMEERLRKEHETEVEIRVRAFVSLNGRPRQPMIDSSVDLTKEPRDLRHADWILPLTTPLPARTRVEDEDDG